MADEGDDAPAVTDDLDGPHASRTLATASRLKADGFNLNRWWVLTPQDWLCPCCRRAKPEIARLDPAGRLYGHLMAHHDHIGDTIQPLFLEIASSREWPGITKLAEDFAKRMAPFVSAHDPTVICSDCNEADAAAKRTVGARPAFSFAPADIGRFIIAAPQSSHRIDGKVLHDFWSRRAPLFDRRIGMIRRIVEFALSEEHWYQPSDYRDRPEAIEGRAAGVLENLARRSDPTVADHVDRVEAYVRAAATPAVSGTTARTWRKHRSRVLAGPPDDRTVAAVAGTSPFWRSVPDDWHCPCCGREKRDIIQPSDSSRAAFTTDKRREHGGGPREKATICCRECGWAVSKLAKEVGAEHHRVSFDDVRAVIRPRRNGSHLLRSDAEIDIVVARVAAGQPDEPWE